MSDAHMDPLTYAKFRDLQDRADAAEALLDKVRIDLAVLLPQPTKPTIDDWPVNNRTDAECLHDAYTNIRDFLEARKQ